jgi:hypothetical protein
LETILYKGDRETLGFGSKDLRFTANMESTPGPGQYGSGGKGCVETLEKNESFGIKGTGSFASRSYRFPFARATGGPGPGAYRAVPISSASDPKVPSASFQKQVDLPIRVGGNRVAPGPGEYNVKLLDSGNCPGAAAFRSRQKRGNFGRDQSATPGPGEYQRAGSAPANARDCRSAFAPPSKSALSDVVPVSSDLPPARREIDPEGVLARPRRALGATVPGPGDYNVDVELREYTACVKGSSAFIEGNSKLPRRPKAETPGPGEYALGSSMNAAGGGRAAFADTQDRNRTAFASAAPGPAYYDQKPSEEKKSFHWNMRKKWV